ncbi:MAG: hypothetical protein DRQ04_06970 [Candidatus Hydrothermota bacterium]|nr:MAG: hypothetical protein DRQ04_06970 [Candidatus Hydrothermae bacterium]
MVRKGYFVFLFILLLAASLVGADSLTQWLGVYLSGQKIGYVYLHVVPLEGGYRVIERNVMSLKMLGQDKEVTTYQVALADRSFRLREFSFSMKTGDQQVSEEGKALKGTLKVSVITGEGSRSERSFLYGGDLYLPSLLEAKAALQGLKSGVFHIFDPSTISLDSGVVRDLGTAEVEYRGEKVTARLYEAVYSGIRTRTWVRDGRILREESPMKIVMVDEPKEKAVQLGGEKVDLLSLFAVEPGGLRVNPADYRFVRLKLSGVSFDNLDLSFDGQKVVKRKGDQVVLSIERADPDSLRGGVPLPDSVSLYLEPTPFIQSDAPEIRDLAREITAGAKDDVDKVRKILEWVYTTLDKKPTVTLPTALDVLKMGYGDCNEHSVLFAALARAAGIPAEITVGLIYQLGRYYYHAWDAVFIGGRWVFVDPIFNEFPASAGHLMLKRGGIEKQADLVPVVGQLKIEILEAR